jgi:nitrogen fixation NifU-like protein
MSAHPSTLYSETVLAHNRAPHNCGCLESATHHGVAENAMCGDHLELSLRVRDGVIDAVMFDGESCAITTACASMLTEALRGGDAARIAELRDEMLAMFRSGPAARDEFAAFAELCHHPARQRCALLPFDAALAALQTRE